jgi:5,10-methylene-tetrahydrofolate dehydrogenase/Methenyl tetrahydrofolate cyclohydrolase
METKIIKGDSVKEKIFDEVRDEIAEIKEKYNLIPGIAFVGFTVTPLSKYVIPLHIQAAEAAGFIVYTELMPPNATEEELFKLIDDLNKRDDIHAILVLQPLPGHLNPIRIINRIDPRKEVEGFHPQNMLSTQIPDIQTEKYPMCLPTALAELFRDAGIDVEEGKEWVFVLDDEFFSNTLTHMVVKSAASKAVPVPSPVSYINKNSDKLIDYCKRADVLVVVTKHPEYIKAEWLKSGVIIVDIYSNLVKEIQSKNDPSKLIPIIRGGVNVESVTNIASVVVPVPGGIVAVVLPLQLRNALSALKNSLNL